MRAPRILAGIVVALAGAIVTGFGLLILISVSLGFASGSSSYSTQTDLLGAFLFGLMPILFGLLLCSASVLIIRSFSFQNALRILGAPLPAGFGLFTGGGIGLAMAEDLIENKLVAAVGVLVFGVFPVLLALYLVKPLLAGKNARDGKPGADRQQRG